MKMNRKGFDGKAIYNPQGKAGEYSEWACNFFTGCSNDCDYCYCKKGYMGRIWGDKPKLKKCFTDVAHALRVFTKEIRQNKERLQKVGIFFTFTSDPMLPETKELTFAAASVAIANGIPVQILTKRADFLDDVESYWHSKEPEERKMVAFGFTLTGHDELEKGASSNHERIVTMKWLHKMGFRTFASIEPIVDFVASTSMISLSFGVCDLFKVGLMSGKKYNDKERMQACFMLEILSNMTETKFYLKDSLIKLLEIDRAVLPAHFVGKDYNIFG